MKVYYLVFAMLLIGCNDKSKTDQKITKTTEDQCFILNEGINFDERVKPAAVPTKEDILKTMPAHIKITSLPEFTSFNYDQKNTEELQAKEKTYFASTEYQNKYKEIIQVLPDFQFLSEQENYTLAKNKYGLWIIEKINEEYKPYFLGLTQNIYLPEVYGKDQKFIAENQFVMKGSVVDIQRLSRVPMLPKYEVIKDGVQFTINLDEVRKDTDQDGFNDLFENFIGLNPDLADTDGDGISDFEDSNPRYKTGSESFTSMYETLVDHGSGQTSYSFVEILTDCPYFQEINTNNIKVLVYNTEEKIPLKDDVLDHFFPKKYSKMKKYKNYDDVYFTDFSDETGDGTISAQMKNGKWQFDKKYTVTFGM
ncbi:hypothetical protein [Kaistella polysaccharea]|uniref:hypothetical protein n=1 Tax=Kaistella polysaccharea TaxID=2878534 RepID=UPI001CF3F918|nr:hypothetical protein [Kaistella polysaccharea]